MNPDNLPLEIVAAQDYIAQAEFESLKDYVVRVSQNRNFCPQAEAAIIALKIEQIEEVGFVGDLEAAKALFEIAGHATVALRKLTKIVNLPKLVQQPFSPVVVDSQETIEEGLRRLARKILELEPVELSNAHKTVSQIITPEGLGRDNSFLPIYLTLFPQSENLTGKRSLTAEIMALLIQKRIDINRQLQLSELTTNSISWPSREFRSPFAQAKWLRDFPSPENLGTNTGLKDDKNSRTPPITKLQRSDLVDWVFGELYNRLRAFPWKQIPEYERRQLENAAGSAGNYLTKVGRPNPPPPPHGHEHNLRLRWQYVASNLPELTADATILSHWSYAGLTYLEYMADGDLKNIEWPAFISERRPGESTAVAARLREVLKDGFRRRAVAPPNGADR